MENTPAAAQPKGAGNAPRPATPPRGGRVKTDKMTLDHCLTVLVVGQMPLVGIIACILWGYGPNVSEWRRKLARAMLCLHGVVLGALIVGLCLWVLMLLNSSTLL